MVRTDPGQPLRSEPVERDGIVRSMPLALLRLEGLVLLSLALFAYARYGGSWWLFALFVLVPDAGALGYLAGPRVGAIAYNALHTYVGAGILVVAGAAADSTLLLSLGFTWFAHIGMDRVVGYGLKYGDAFGHTHLGLMGTRRAR